MMKKIEKGHFVKLNYHGTLENGEVFDSSEGCHPFEVQVGTGQVIKGFEEALLGMTLNEKKTFTLDPSEAFGDRDNSLTHQFSRDDFPEGFEPEVGEVIVLQNPEQGEIPAVIKSILDDSVVVDLNHPLAGEKLTFTIEVLEINDQASPSSCGSCCSCH